MASIRNSNGFSLVEAMVVIAIVAIMGVFAVPSMISWLNNKGLQNAARDMYSNLRKAQSIAVKNNRNCAISFNGTTGYTVYVDLDKDYERDAGEEIIAQASWSQYRNVVLDGAVNFADNASSQPTVAFRPNLIPLEAGGTAGNGTISLKNDKSRKADITISVSGNISMKWL
ncbi:MAG: GspH/FimT family pseudopilin [Desulfoprunum sp.]|jgi:prepilin-type N-terminal cleavage/methylation domain-containing protein